jgi:hypothetical protein
MTNPQQMLADLEWQLAAGADEAVGDAPGLMRWQGAEHKGHRDLNFLS